MQHILRGSALQNYKAFLVEYKQLAKDIAGDKCTLGTLKDLSTDNVWTWENSDGIVYDGDVYLGPGN